jgi:phosphate transport system permease protein
MPDKTMCTLPPLSRMAERLYEPILWLCGLIGMTLPVGIICYMLAHGIGVLSLDFIFGSLGGRPLGSAGGIGPALAGTLALAGIGLLLAFPLGLGGALFLTEYENSSSRLCRACLAAVECMAAIPAIIYGLFGYAALVVFLGWQISLRAGAVTLALVMYPIILIGSRAALVGVHNQYREAALSLGVSRLYTIRRVLLPRAWPGIVSATILGFGHAASAAAPILFTASVFFSRGDLSLNEPVMTLPTHLYFLVTEAISFPHAYGTACVLIVVMLMSNICAMLARRLGGQHRQ